MGNMLAINLANTWYTATQDLPRVAAEFAGLSGDSQAAAGSAATELGRIAAPWEALNAELQTYTSKTATDLYDAGDTLARVTRAFAKADGVHAAFITQATALTNSDNTPLKDSNNDGLYNSDDTGLAKPQPPDKDELDPDLAVERNYGRNPRIEGVR